ncbi:hypothetical protein CHU_1675 [Sporocytophaga myxococcoides]|uniref:DUF7793 domain-containing protein n=1 Tax=Sporocytophaga myxococcoides TaxID=153721 RepID=A0A098L9Z1_9BACT|nr:hypothetical protein [Sporocytophaga myxococcoides]GAL83133.1 hypothetical protein CHU_1675 [Sporocytophaga myxococcoides]
MKENHIVSKYSETWLENGVILQVLNQEYNEVDLPMARQLVEDRKIAAGNAIRPVLVEVKNVISVRKEAKKYYNLPDSYQNLSAIAMLVDNYIAKTIGNIVFKLQNNPVPTELFNDRSKALNWLERYKRKE